MIKKKRSLKTHSIASSPLRQPWMIAAYFADVNVGSRGHATQPEYRNRACPGGGEILSLRVVQTSWAGRVGDQYWRTPVCIMIFHSVPIQVKTLHTRPFHWKSLPSVSRQRVSISTTARAPSPSGETMIFLVSRLL